MAVLAVVDEEHRPSSAVIRVVEVVEASVGGVEADRHESIIGFGAP